MGIFGGLTVSSFTIEFDSDHVFTGSDIKGKVKLVIIKGSLKARNMKLVLTGTIRINYKKTVYQKQRKGPKKKVILDKTFDNVFYTHECMILHPGDHKIGEGTNEYPFQWKMPGSSPSSFKCKKATIVYKAKVDIDVPMGFDKSAEKVISVTGLQDLNGLSNISQEASAQGTMSVGFLCCKSGDVSAKIHVDKSGFVPGETIDMKIEIDNGSSKNLKVATQFLQDVKFQAPGVTLSPDIEVVTRQDLSDQGQGQLAPLMQSFKVPAVCPSTLGDYSTLIVAYKVMVEITPSGGVMPSPLELQIPVTIGNIPHKDSFAKLAKSSDEKILPEEISSKYEGIPEPRLVFDWNGMNRVEYL